MKLQRANIMLIVCLGMASSAWSDGTSNTSLHSRLAAYVDARLAEFGTIPTGRVRKLEELAAYVSQCRSASRSARLTFICTHNSRRSHISQLWAAAAAAHFGVAGVETYSGGTESTAFNPRAVAALRRAGFEIAEPMKSANPKYRVSFVDGAVPQICFSKVYHEAPNPTQDFCAVMTCSEADENCPIVAGASLRLAIPYDDPKIADGTPEEAQRYDERCAQIARELLFVFSKVD